MNEGSLLPGMPTDEVIESERVCDACRLLKEYLDWVYSQEKN